MWKSVTLSALKKAQDDKIDDIMDQVEAAEDNNPELKKILDQKEKEMDEATVRNLSVGTVIN